MSRGVNVMHWLRGRNRPIGGALLPVLAAVWLSASTSHCFGMAAASDEHSVTAHHPAGHAEHSQTPLQQAPGGDHDHGKCPHCPPSPTSLAGRSAEHIGCATLVDGAPISKAPQPEFKGGPQFLAPEFVSEATSRPPPRPPPRSFDHRQPDIPLNLRHCVFLI
jgi:hypothetical protein